MIAKCWVSSWTFEMIAMLGQFPDENLFSDIIIGCRLSGWMTDSQVFKNLPRPPKLTLEALLKTSLGLQKSSAQTCPST